MKIQQLKQIIIKPYSYYILLIWCLINSCATQQPAPIEFRSPSIKNDTSKYYISEMNNKTISTHVIQTPLTPPGSNDDNLQPKLSNNNDTTGRQADDVKNNYKLEYTTNVPNNNQKIDNKFTNKVSNLLNKEPSNIKQPNNQTHNTDNTKTMYNQELGFLIPVEGKIIRKFDTNNQGINIAAKNNTPVKSIQNGQVVYAGYDDKFGNLIIIKLLDSNIFVAFAHLNDLSVAKDQQINKGQIIGHVGQTGDVKEPQLYLALKQGKTSIDPLIYINIDQ